MGSDGWAGVTLAQNEALTFDVANAGTWTLGLQRPVGGLIRVSSHLSSQLEATSAHRTTPERVNQAPRPELAAVRAG